MKAQHGLQMEELLCFSDRAQFKVQSSEAGLSPTVMAVNLGSLSCLDS